MTPPNNYGIQNNTSMVNAPQAAGPFASAQQQVNHVSGAADATGTGLAEAVEKLGQELSWLRTHEPQTVSTDNANTAESSLHELAVIADQPTPASRHALRRHIRAISTALAETSALATALAALETAVHKLMS
jgi:hypothetical protein